MINIILCTYNSNYAFLTKQLDSLFNQSYKKIKVFIFDDSTTNVAYNVFTYYKKKYRNKIYYKNGSKTNSFSDNFLTALKKIKINHSKKNYFMFCDQDDIWELDKIDMYISTLKKYRKYDIDKPLLIGGRTHYINANDEILIKSPNFPKKPALENALIQSIFGGNSILFNEKLFLIVNSFKETKIFSHDWWLYILNETFSGKTIFLDDSKTLYRQHEDSIIGGNIGLRQNLRRAVKFFLGDFKKWSDMHCATFENNYDVLPSDKVKIIRNYFMLRSSKNIILRFKLFFKLGLYRQDIFSTIIYALGILIFRI